MSRLIADVRYRLNGKWNVIGIDISDGTKREKAYYGRMIARHLDVRDEKIRVSEVKFRQP